MHSRRAAPRWSFALACVVCLAACSKAPHREQLAHGRFERLELTAPTTPRSVVLLLTSAGNEAHAEALGAQLSNRDALVVRVDAEPFIALLDATPSRCVFPSGDLDNLAHFIQAYVKLPRYQPAVLVGLGAGAELAAAALAQSRPGTFAGALTVGDCGRRVLRAPLCSRDGPSSSSAAPAAPPDAPAVPPADPIFALRSSAAPQCHPERAAPGGPARDESAFLELFDSLAASSRAHATAAPPGLDELPIVEVAATGPGHADTFGVLLSGDGGWAGIDEELSARLARHGLPIVGIDSLRYFWRARTPESTAADVQRVIEHYQSAWKRERAVLIGYSQGADVLPFIINRLPTESRRAVVSAVALSLSTTATFEFHLASWVGASGDRPTMPEVQRLARGPLWCVYGKDDGDALCPDLDPDVFHVVQLPGAHHFDGDYERVSAVVLAAIPPPPAR
jgi:type IV secretory pathway VirJ component